jgi:uncharacterized repeat protein (TIGR01451 family)
MHRHISRTLATALLAMAMFAPAAAHASDPVHVALSAQRVTTQNGHETFAPADKARPGEVIEYRATYRNDSPKPIHELIATLPIPNGVEYLSATAAPAGVQASTDGRHYAAVPLMRTARDANGREVQREVPLAEYRSLRWTIGGLDAKQSRTVAARVRVATSQVAVLSR